MSTSAEMIRTTQESLQQLVNMKPVAIHTEDGWEFFPSAEQIAQGAYFRERVLEIAVEVE